MNAQPLAAFGGNVQCGRGAGAVQWCLGGHDRDNGAALEVLLSGAAALRLPAQFVDAELYAREQAGGLVWELHSAGQVVALPVRAVQIHRRADAAFAAALPAAAVPWSVRASWFLLLNLLRVPGMGRLLRAVRARGEERGP
jgi:hypothetical protein